MNFKIWLEEAHKFSCVLADLPAQEAKKVITWANKNIQDRDICQSEGGRENEPHITVLYGLHDKTPENVQEIIKHSNKLEATLGLVSVFSTHPDYDVLKIDVNSKSFHELNKKLKELDYTSNFPIYKPHCTLAYIKKDCCKNLIGDKSFQGIKVTFNTVVFSSANGQKTKITIHH